LQPPLHFLVIVAPVLALLGEPSLLDTEEDLGYETPLQAFIGFFTVAIIISF